jgi:predicted negative regulator of RcsB-dependent stress response
MAYDHEEQEQLDSIKTWWNQYSNTVTWLLIAALAAYAAWNGWNYFQRNQSVQASQLYMELQKAIVAKDLAKVQRATADMEAKFSRTAYAQMSALVAAKYAFDLNDLKMAKEQLQWVISNSADDEYKAIAKIRFAGILLDEKSYGDGLKLLSSDFSLQFAGLVADRKGDFFVAQNKIDEARASYQLALDKIDPKNPIHQLIQMKLDAIGGAPAKAAG